MSAFQRNKGARGEREVAAIISDLLGYKVSRRCRQHDGDSDLEGVPGWSLEVKNQAHVSRALLKAWWQQAVDHTGLVARDLGPRWIDRLAKPPRGRARSVGSLRPRRPS